MAASARVSQRRQTAYERLALAGVHLDHDAFDHGEGRHQLSVERSQLECTFRGDDGDRHESLEVIVAPCHVTARRARQFRAQARIIHGSERVGPLPRAGDQCVVSSRVEMARPSDEPLDGGQGLTEPQTS